MVLLYCILEGLHFLTENIDQKPALECDLAQLIKLKSAT